MSHPPGLRAVLVRHADHGWLADRFGSWADAHEQARAAAFHHHAHRQDHVISHAALRLVLARTTGVAPGSMVFGHSATGKPWIDPADMAPPVPAFSLSHSAGHSLIVTSAREAVGADIEMQRSDHDWPRLAPLFASPADACAISPAATALLACWVLKEAALKLTGEGLSRDPRTLAITSSGTDRFSLQGTDGGFPEIHARLFRWPVGLHGAIATFKAELLEAIDIECAPLRPG